MNLLAMKRSMEQIDNPLITVVTVVFNDVQHIEDTILSVVNQTYPNIEYIIIDGGSTDGTVDIIKKYEERIAYWVSEPDKGIYDAMNKGLSKATGEWVNFMNSGDCFVDFGILGRLLSFLRLDKVSIYGSTIYVRQNVEQLEMAYPVSFIPRNMPTSHQAFFIKTRDAKLVGFDMSYRYAADYNMVHTLYKKNGQNSFMNVLIPVVKYEANEGVSALNSNEVFGETLRIRSLSTRWLWDLMKYEIKKLMGRK